MSFEGEARPLLERHPAPWTFGNKNGDDRTDGSDWGSIAFWDANGVKVWGTEDPWVHCSHDWSDPPDEIVDLILQAVGGSRLPEAEESLEADTCCEHGYDEAHIWTTAGGDEIPMCKMSDKHLRNSIGYLSRKLREAQGSGWEMAPNGMDLLIGLGLDEMEHKLGLLEDEKKRREAVLRAVLG